MKRLLCALVVAVTVASVAGIMAQTPDPGRGGVWVTGAGGAGGDITEVVAGAGMTGGGTEGDVTLNVIGTADAITVSADAVTIASTYVGQTSITTLGTVATGTWQATDVGVAYGGTGVSTLADGYVLLGSGAGAITPLDVTADGAMLVGDGTGDPVAESGATLRTSVGVGTGDSPQFTGLTVSGTGASALDVGGGLNIGTGNVALVGTDGRLNGPLSSTIIDDLSAANLTAIPGGQITGAIAAVSGANLTTLNATNISSGTLAEARLPTGISVANGGTGVSSLTANSLLLGAGTSDVTFAAPGTSGNVLTSNGTVWASAAPSGAGTSLDTGTVEYAGRTITVDTGGVLNVVLASAAGDDFTVDTDKLLVSGDTGYVGINQANPTRILHVVGDITLQSSQAHMSDGYGLLWGDNGFNGNAATDSLRFDTAGGQRLGIDSAGLVTVGNNLSVVEFIQVGTTSVSTGINTPKSTYFNIDSDNNATGEVFLWGTNRATVSGGTELMRLTEAGLLGIGTNDPKSALHVSDGSLNGNIHAGGNTTVLGSLFNHETVASGYTNISMLNNTGGANARINLGFGVIASNVPTNTVMTLNQSGNVGIAETAPNDPLHITTGTAGAVTMIRLQHDNSSTNDAVSIDANMTSDITTSGQINFKRVGTNAATDIIFSNTNTTGGLTERVRFTHDGLVGIGLDTPARRLHVHQPDASWSVVQITNNGTGVTSTDGFQLQEVGAAAYVYNYENGSMHFGTNTIERLAIAASGAVSVIGAFSKGSGSFKIDHPLPALSETHNLVHSFIEGPRADLIYRGMVELVDGSATVDLDDAAGMTSGTWALLCRDPQVFTSNATGWSPVRGTVSGSTLTIECEEGTCTDTISWMVVAERQDQHILDTDWTDEDGRPIIEPLKPPPSAPAPTAPTVITPGDPA